MVFIYAVKCGVHCKKISVQEKNVDALKSALKDEFPQLPQQILIQLWDPDFEEFFDVTNPDSLPDKGKLNIVALTQPAVPAVQDQSQQPAAPQAAPEVQQAGTSADDNGCKPFPLVYRLPQFAPSIQAKLATNPADVLLEDRLVDSIIQSLHDDLCQYENGYPRTEHYNTVCKTLVTTYGALADKGRCRGTLYGTWKYKLRNKFKYQRSLLLNNPMVTEMRAKFGHARGQKRPATPDSVESPKRDTVRHMVFKPSAAEDEASTNAHIEKIRNEWQKMSPDLEVVHDRMQRTMTHRAELYKGPVEGVVNSFPNLQDSFQIIADCNRYFGVNFTQARQLWWNTDKVEFLLKKVGRSTLSGNLIPATLRDSQERQELRVLALLPVLFREKVDKWVRINKPVPAGPYTGVVVTTSDSNETNDIQPGASFQIYLDGVALCGNSPSLPLALDTLMSVLFLFNVAYPKGLTKACRFYTEVMCGVTCTSPLPANIQAIVNTLLTIQKESACSCNGNCECEADSPSQLNVSL